MKRKIYSMLLGICMLISYNFFTYGVAEATISVEEAQCIAVEHTGYKEFEATIRCVIEGEKYGQKMVEIQFEVAGHEYVYEVSLETGEILKADRI